MISTVIIGCPPEPEDPIGNTGTGDRDRTGYGNVDENEIPDIPGFFAATAGDGAITLSWDTSARAASYEIYRGSGRDKPDDEPIATVSAESAAMMGYVDDGLTNGSSYRYAIAAINNVGTSGRSAIVEATVGDVIRVDVDKPIAAIDERAGGDEITIAHFRATMAGDGEQLDNIVYASNALSDGHPFIISGNRLIFPAGAAIDYEALSAIQQAGGMPLTIQASGAGGITGSIDIAVPIANIDDEAPVFGAIPDSVVIEDGATQFANGALKIYASDDADDLGDPEDEIAYVFVHDDGTTTGEAMGFSIDRMTGEITVATAPTYSENDAAANRLVLAIQALDISDGAVGDRVARDEITIVVTPPILIALRSSKGISFAIDESDDVPIEIAVISIANEDSTPAPATPYTIISGHDGFAIDGDGQLTATIDYESLSAKQQAEGLSVTIQGENSEGDIGIITLTITARNIDDEAPVFAATTPTEITIKEGKSVFNIDPLTVVAIDDIGGEISYSFVDGTGAASHSFEGFAIDAATGEITVATAPTYSENDPAANRRMIAIQAIDTTFGAIGALVGRIEITIEITPKITLELQSTEGISFAIDESDDAPIEIAVISIANEDSTPATYTIISGHYGFAIDASGQLTARIDYESLYYNQQTEGLSVTIQGENSEGDIGTIELTIMTRNIDDEAPVFAATIPKNITIGEGQQGFSIDPALAALIPDFTSFGGGSLSVSAIDDLGSEIGYAFLNSDGTTTDTTADMSIDYNTGEITIITPPTYSEDDPAANRRIIAIQAIDRTPGAVGELEGRIDITLTIRPKVTLELQSTEGISFAIDESDDAPIDIAVISIANEDHSPAATTPYTIRNGHSGFAIDADGQLTAMIDYESLTNTQQTLGLSVTIEGEDSDGNIGFIFLAIATRNTDDEAPIFAAIPTDVTIEEGSTEFDIGTFTVVARDDLGDEISYSFVDEIGDASQNFDDFAIDAATGDITAATAPAYSENDPAANRRSIVVQAMDTTSGAVGETVGRIDIAIEITPVVFPDLRSSEGTSFAIDESDDAPIYIATMSIANEDISLPATAAPYTIIDGHAGFAIADDGRLTAMIDYESLTNTQQTNGLSVTIRGENAAGHSSDINLTIEVQNADDEAPVFDPVPTDITIEEGSTVFNTGTLAVVAHDDIGDEISYSFVDEIGFSSQNFGDFAIDAATGDITAATAPTYSKINPAANRRTIAIQAIDTTLGAIGEIVGAVDIAIEITPIIPPDLRSTEGISFSIDESDDAPIDIAIISIANEEISLPATTTPYTITDGHAGFAIADDGRLTAMIDYESLSATQQANGLSVTIRGENAAGHSSAIDLTIEVRNTDDEAPVFTAIPTEIAIGSGAIAFNIDPLTIVAADDLGGEISYAFVDEAGIVSHNFEGFAIDAVTGKITVATPPTYSENDAAANRRTIAIQATDTTSVAIGETIGTVDIEIVITPMITLEIQSTEGMSFSIDESDDAPIDIATMSVENEGIGPTAIDSYTITNGHAGFAITEDGQLTAMIDYESLSATQQANGLSVTIHVENTAGHFGSARLEIAVQNTDDEAPIFDEIPTNITIVSEKSSFSIDPLTIVATDDIGGEITYSLNADGFAINAATGEITITDAPIYSKTDAAANRRTIVARATDTSANALGAKVAEATVNIDIIPLVDRDGDGLIDIATLEQLDNIRYNLSGASYKISADDAGQSGGCPDFVCSGYELTRDLHFAEAESYESGVINGDWRPNEASPADASNEGWTPIGSCNDDTNDSGAYACGDADDNPFNTRLNGNGHTITRLYTRSESGVGLLSVTGPDAIVQNIGILKASAYGDGKDDRDQIGVLVGANGGTIIASFANGVADGDRGGLDAVGVLAGSNSGRNYRELLARSRQRRRRHSR